MKAVIITTEHRGVFYGFIENDQDVNARTMPLKNAKMAIKWGTDKGVMQLARTGPTNRSKISAEADIPALHDITAVFVVTEEAQKQWNKY